MIAGGGLTAGGTCAHCGFDASDYTHSDLLGTLRALAPIWRTMTAGVDPSLLTTAPAPGTRAAVDALAVCRRAVDTAAEALLRVLRANPPAPVAIARDAGPLTVGASLGDAADDLEAAAAQLSATASAMTDAEWERPVVVDGEALTVAGLLASAVHRGVHEIRGTGRVLHALGAGAPTARGTLVQVSASNGGVPKHALAAASIDRHGLVGDTQNDRVHHGRPLQAICLWSSDVIDALRDEGHPITPGAAGENLTVAGIDWSTIRPGVQLTVGPVALEISAFATPCAKNAPWFRDRDFDRMHHDSHPGWSRAYAWVIEGGPVAPGDPVVIEP